MSKYSFLKVFGLCLLVGCLGLVGACTSKTSFNSTDISDSPIGKTFRLTDHNGQVRSLSDFKNKVVIVQFGFLQCPDICPTSLLSMRRVMKELGTDADRVQLLFVTVDPERDSAKLLKQYVTQFDSRFLGLRGTPAETKSVANSFKVFYDKVPSKTAGSYTMEHSTGSYVFDPTGAIRLYVKMNQDPIKIAADIRQLLVGH